MSPGADMAHQPSPSKPHLAVVQCLLSAVLPFCQCCLSLCEAGWLSHAPPSPIGRGSAGSTTGVWHPPSIHQSQGLPGLRACHASKQASNHRNARQSRVPFDSLRHPLRQSPPDYHAAPSDSQQHSTLKKKPKGTPDSLGDGPSTTVVRSLLPADPPTHPPHSALLPAQTGVTMNSAPLPSSHSYAVHSFSSSPVWPFFLPYGRNIFSLDSCQIQHLLLRMAAHR